MIYRQTIVIAVESDALLFFPTHFLDFLEALGLKRTKTRVVVEHALKRKTERSERKPASCRARAKLMMALRNERQLVC